MLLKGCLLCECVRTPLHPEESTVNNLFKQLGKEKSNFSQKRSPSDFLSAAPARLHKQLASIQAQLVGKTPHNDLPKRTTK